MQIVKYFLVILIEIAIVFSLGFFFYQKLFVEKNAIIENEVVSDNSRQQSSRDTLSDAERALFDAPGVNASEEEKKEYTNLIAKSAQSVDQILIRKDCSISPLVLRVGNSQSIKFKNEDIVVHRITLGVDKEYKVDPGSAAEIAVTPDMKGKLLGYGCDNVEKNGFLVIYR